MKAHVIIVQTFLFFFRFDSQNFQFPGNSGNIAMLPQVLVCGVVTVVTLVSHCRWRCDSIALTGNKRAYIFRIVDCIFECMPDVLHFLMKQS